MDFPQNVTNLRTSAVLRCCSVAFFVGFHEVVSTLLGFRQIFEMILNHKEGIKRSKCPMSDSKAAEKMHAIKDACNIIVRTRFFASA